MAFKEKGGTPGATYHLVLTCFDEENEGGYRAAEDTSPPTIMLRCPSEAEKRELMDYSFQGKRGYVLTAEIISPFIKGVKNYKASSGKDIKTAKDFSEHARAGAILEVFETLVSRAEAFQRTEEEEKKDSES